MEYELLGFTSSNILAVAASVIIIFLLQALFIWFGAKFARIKNASFGKAFGSAIAITVLLIIVNVILSLIDIANNDLISIVVSILITIWVLKSLFNTNWIKAMIAWIMSIIGMIVASAIIVILLDLSLNIMI